MTQDEEEFGAPAEAASLVRSALERACPGSVTRLRGSLAAGRADAYSDMDIEWRVPADRFAACVREPGTVLRDAAHVLREAYGDAWPRRRAPATARARAMPGAPEHSAPVSGGPEHSAPESGGPENGVPEYGIPEYGCAVRTDPEYAHSPGARLLFVRFPGLPLFWRLDLMVLAEGGTAAGEGPGGAVPETEWSLPASALENAIAAVKAVARADPETAAGLLRRGLDRLGAHPGPREAARGRGEPRGPGREERGTEARDWPAAVGLLVRAAVRAEPALAELGAQTEDVARRLLPPGPGDARPGVPVPLRWPPAATDGSADGPGAAGT
ncbi:hypothetical protein [Streptomyces sp. NPDC007088]|uniref:hypothetical protein n=1 Tax=Streptomyces sp. NPDC007088 TaxID=3364773 RepID=UPI0036B0A5B3